MGGLFKSRTNKTQAPFESNPWEPQQPFLEKGFEAASEALTSGNSILSGIGDYAADMTPGQVAGAQLMERIGTGKAQDLATLFGNNTGQGVEALGSAIVNAMNMLNGAKEDPTDAIIANGRRFADNPFLEEQIDSVLKDVRGAFDRDVANINSAAAGSGNVNSTRAAALEAMAMDDAMDRAADISSSMRMSALESGLDRAMTTEQNRFANSMAANEMLAAMGGRNAEMGLTGLDVASTGARMALESGNIFQDQAQMEIDGERLRVREPLDLVNLYMGAVGRNFGSNGFQTQVSRSPSPFQQILGVASTLGGLGFKPFG